MQNIFKRVKEEYAKGTCYPPKNLIFNAFKQCPFKKLKVVLVGQDPYIKENEAMGLCFSIPKGTKVPPSLQNVYKALVRDPKVKFEVPKPIHGDLSNWAKQGVFMLNAILTVQAGKSDSHKDLGWLEFTKHVLNVINKQKKGTVFMIWGKKAEVVAKDINKSDHQYLYFGHPSPLGLGAKFD